jgi:hypothetical protein
MFNLLPRVAPATKWARGCLLLLALGLAAGFGPPRAQPTQAQVARQFLVEILAESYPVAYRRLAPEVRAALPLPAFASAARPLWQQGQAHGPAIEFYQIGARLGSGLRPGQWFCRFAFTQDSSRRPPPVLLEVTFRDTTTRQVLGFRVRP